VLYLNRYCGGKSVSIRYRLCALAAFGIQHAMRMHHIVIYGLPGSTIYFHIYLINGTNFWGKKFIDTKCVF
jgi:hypothetical protein